MATTRHPRATTVQDGEVLLGFRLKLYPTQEQLHWLGCAQAELMAAWNDLCTSRSTHYDHMIRRAEDDGAIGPLPPRPMSDHKTNVPEEIAQWREYERLCGHRRGQAIQHANPRGGSPIAGLSWAEWEVDYRTLRNLHGGRDSIAQAQMYTALCHRFKQTCLRGDKPVLKRRAVDMPLVVRSGQALSFNGEYSTRRTTSGRVVLSGDHKCWVRFGPLRIKGRFHRPPPGPTIEGVSIVLEADGWYASVRCRAQPRPLPAPTEDIIAVNAGLECLYADSTGHVIENPRGNQYSLRARELSEWIDDAGDDWTEHYRRNQLARYQARFARRVKHLIQSEILPRLSPYATILLGQTGVRAAQGPQTRISSGDEGGYTSAMGMMHAMIIQRFGLYDREDNPTGRVRLLPAAGISRRCSQCGTEHASRYARNNSRRRDQLTDCPSCGARIHVDVNAARNLLTNYLTLQVAAE
jgi:hypothetical protein